MSLDLIATVYGETSQGGTVESPVPLTGVSSFKVDSNTIILPIPRPLHKVGDVRDVCQTRVKSVYDKHIVLSSADGFSFSSNAGNGYARFYKAYNSAKLSPIASDWLPGYAKTAYNATNEGVYSADSDAGTISIVLSIQRLIAAGATSGDTSTYLSAASAIFSAHPLTVYYQSTAYDGTNGLDVCLTEYQTDFAELDGKNVQAIYYQNNGRPYGLFVPRNIIKTNDGVVCSQAKTEPANLNWGYVYAANVPLKDIIFGLIGSDITSGTELNAYLAAQKEAGTPVQVAYQLATPEVYATDPLDIYVTTMFPVVVSTGPITYEVIPQIHPFKTDWKIQPKTPEGYYNGDWFEIEDYNHILDNYQTIYKIAKALYPDLQIPTFVSPTLGAPTKASEINTIERTIDAFKTLTIALSDVGATKTWLDNGNLFNFEDINRWEQVALSYYTVFLGQVELLPKLQFKLGGAQF